MEFQEARLILEGVDRRFVIGADFWDDIVSWAIEQGGICETLGKNRRWVDCCEFSAEESARLAESLEIIGGNLILHSNADVSDDFIAKLADALLTLQQFAASGGFRVIPFHGSSEIRRNK